MSHFNMGWPCPWRSLVFFLRVFGAMPCLLAPRGHAAKRIDHIPQRRPQYLGTDLDNMVNTCQYLSSTLVKLIFWQSSAHCTRMCQVAMLEVALFVAFHDWMFHCIWVNGKLLLMLAPSLSKSPWQLLQTMCLRSLQMKEKKQFLPGFYPFSSKYPPFSLSLLSSFCCSNCFPCCRVLCCLCALVVSDSQPFPTHVQQFLIMYCIRRGRCLLQSWLYLVGVLSLDW